MTNSNTMDEPFGPRIVVHEEAPPDVKALARELSAKLLPHTTSVQNVDLIAGVLIQYGDARAAEMRERSVLLSDEYRKVNHGHLSLNPRVVLYETSAEISDAIRALPLSTAGDDENT